MSLSAMLEFALALAEAAEAEIMPRFRRCAVSWKPDGSEVTEADRRGEEVMREMIAQRFPAHGVLGEEFGGPREGATASLWVLDPIDGTTSFALGLPMFGTLIGYLENNEPQLGVIHMPALGETVYAVKGAGCRLRRQGEEKMVHVSDTRSMEQAFISVPGAISNRLGTARKVRAIGDCIQHALVAQGRIDCAIDPVMNPWDIAALVPCVEEAGGVVSDLNGARENVVWRPSLVRSANNELHHQVLDKLRLV
jgi:histidinol-phosphatase